MLLTASGGLVRSGFEPVAEVFEKVLANRPGYGAALCVYADGEPQIDLWGGPPYCESSVQVVFSATKAAVALCAARLVQRGQLDLDAPVESLWPEFGQQGKANIPVRWLLSHRAGLPTVDRPLRFADLGNTPLLVGALEQQAPYWEPGTAHGYHPWSLGTLVGELVRRTSGRSLGQFFASEIAEPLGLDFWIGLPDELKHRVVPLRTGPLSMTETTPAIAAALGNPESLTYKTMSNGLLELTQGCNDRSFHAAEIPAANGIGSARALARMYAACVGPVDGVRLVDEAVLAEFCEPQSVGVDLVALEESRFGLGFQLPFPRIPFLGPTSFGHDGAGGALAFADRASKTSFAFLPDLFPPLGGADPDTDLLVAAVRDAINGSRT